jgi:hypothetical protein
MTTWNPRFKAEGGIPCRTLIYQTLSPGGGALRILAFSDGSFCANETSAKEHAAIVRLVAQGSPPCPLSEVLITGPRAQAVAWGTCKK